jgi:hypothetical protein
MLLSTRPPHAVATRDAAAGHGSDCEARLAASASIAPGDVNRVGGFVTI